MSKSQRITFEKNAKKLATSVSIGPGKYNYNKEDVGNTGILDPNRNTTNEPIKESAAFKSQVERLGYMEPKIKTFVGGKLVKGTAARNKSLDVNGNVTIIPEISPGPGDYFATNNLTSLNVQSKPHHLQFFGTTEERVPYYDVQKVKSDINSEFRGPGLYNYEHVHKDVPRQDKFHKGKSSSFASGRDRDLLFGGNSNPAPGDYRSHAEVNRLNGKVWSKICTFGTTEKRFQKQIPDMPGPGNYSLLNKPVKKKAVSGSVFKSNTKRSLFANNKKVTSETRNQQVYNTEE